MVARWGIEVDRVMWYVVGAVMLGVLAFVLHSFIGTFVFGIFLYYATRPMYRVLNRYVRPSSLAALAALLLLALPALLLVAYTLAVGLQEANRVLRTVELAGLEAALAPYIDVSRIVQDPQQLLDQPDARAVVQQFVNNALSYLGFIGNAALHLFVMITVAFYLLRDDRRLSAWFRGTFSDDTLAQYGRAVDRDFSNIFFGNILNAALTGVIGTLVYSGLDIVAPAGVGIPYPALVGLLAGVASLVPIVGMKLVYVPVALYLTAAAVQLDTRLVWFPGVFFLVSFVVVDVIPDLVLRPYVSGRGLHIGMVMFAYIFGPLLFGWYGIFLGPMLLVLVVHFVRVVLPTLTGAEDPGFEDSEFEPARVED